MGERESILVQAQALGLKLSEDGQRWLLIDANSVNSSVADSGVSKNSDPSMKSEPKLGILALNYLALFAVLGLSFFVVIVINNFLLFYLLLFTASATHAFIVSHYLGKEFNKGLGLAFTISLPVSIWSYFNELKYGCFCLFSCSCPPTPSYYEYPRFIALIVAILLVIYSVVLQVGGKRSRGFGVFVGLIVSAVVFWALTIIGFWS